MYKFINSRLYNGSTVGLLPVITMASCVAVFSRRLGPGATVIPRRFWSGQRGTLSACFRQWLLLRSLLIYLLPFPPPSPHNPCFGIFPGPAPSPSPETASTFDCAPHGSEEDDLVARIVRLFCHGGDGRALELGHSTWHWSAHCDGLRLGLDVHRSHRLLMGENLDACYHRA